MIPFCSRCLAESEGICYSWETSVICVAIPILFVMAFAFVFVPIQHDFSGRPYTALQLCIDWLKSKILPK